MFEWLKRNRPKPEETEAAPCRHLVVPFGFGRVGAGVSWCEIDGKEYPCVVIFPRGPELEEFTDAQQGEPIPDDLQPEKAPDGSILIPFASPEAAHDFVGLVLQSLVQQHWTVPNAADND